MQLLYKEIPQNARKILYKKIGKLKLRIDKKDARELINECIDAINTGRKDEAIAIYNEIKPIYRRLPKKYQKKIYSKIIKALEI